MAVIAKMACACIMLMRLEPESKESTHTGRKEGRFHVDHRHGTTDEEHAIHANSTEAYAIHHTEAYTIHRTEEQAVSRYPEEEEEAVGEDMAVSKYSVTYFLSTVGEPSTSGGILVAVINHCYIVVH
jgi:hypothetical protein